MKNHIRTLFSWLSKQKFIKFLLVGGSAAFLDFVIFYFVINLSKPTNSFFSLSTVTLANVLGSSAGFIFSFLLQRAWTFDVKTQATLRLIFVLILFFANTTITSLLLPIWADFWQVNLSSSKIAMQILVVLWNFLIYKYLIFKANKNAK